MSVQSLNSDVIDSEDQITVLSLFSIVNSLVNVSFADSDLELNDALDYLQDVAVKCEN